MPFISYKHARMTITFNSECSTNACPVCKYHSLQLCSYAFNCSTHYLLHHHSYNFDSDISIVTATE